MKILTIVASLAALLGGLVASPSRAGGLYLSSFGTPSMGTASAGANAVAHDASTAFQNSAGMTRLDDHELLIGLAPGFAKVEFRQSADSPLIGAPPGSKGSNGGNQGGFIPLTSSQYVHKLSERLRLGLSLISVSGAVLDPSDDWAGRNEVTDIDLFTLSFKPSLGVRVTDWLSLGAGALVSYGTLDVDVKAPATLFPDEPTVRIRDADDWAVAPTASVLIEVTPELRLGVVYAGETDFEFDGKIDALGASGGIDLDLDLARAVRTSLYWQATDQLALLASGGWEDWSTLDDIPVGFGPVDGAIPTKFKDTWYLAGGFHYRKDKTTWQLGVRYDSSPVADRDRLALLPLDRIWTVGFGALHDYSESLRIGFAFNWADLGRASLDTGSVKGRYEKNQVFLFNVSFRIKDLPWAGKLTL